MARLNEPAPAPESFDNLKRRFVRQNRELARSNSNQSIKIRALQQEVYSLLSENTALQQKITRLETFVEDGSEDGFSEGVGYIKTRLSEKVHDVLDLVQDLEDLNTSQGRKRPGDQRHLRASSRQKECRNNPTLSEVITNQEGKLPTIVEDKYYPRKTLEPRDLRQLFSDAASDSPDLGPPPQSQFDQTVTSKSDQSDPNEYSNHEEDFAGFLSANLDTRRRRRETRVRPDKPLSNSNDIACTNKETVPSARVIQVGGNPIRAGAKRKLEHREQTEVSMLSSSSTGVNGTPFKTFPIPMKSPARKPLGQKSVNTDPMISPQKTRQKSESSEGERRLPVSSEVKPALAAYSGHTKSPSRSKSTDDMPINKDERLEFPIHSIKLEPQTPKVLDLFSPGSSQPSESHPETREGTPPPSDLRSEGQITSASDPSAAGRGGRRARPAVSYAEPKLNVKMRRPGKELTDAVARTDRRSESAQPESQDEQPSSQRQTLNSAIKSSTLSSKVSPGKCPRAVSREQAKPQRKEQDRRSEPRSPLGQKYETDSIKSQDSAATHEPRTSHFDAAARRTAETFSSQQRRRSSEQFAKEDVGDEGKSNGDVFDMSVSPEASSSHLLGPICKANAKVNSSNGLTRATSEGDLNSANRDRVASRQSSGKAFSVRRKTVAPSGSGTTEPTADQVIRALGHKRSGGMSALGTVETNKEPKGRNSSQGSNGGQGSQENRNINKRTSRISGAVSGSDRVSERAERIAARRKSMML